MDTPSTPPDLFCEGCRSPSPQRFWADNGIELYRSYFHAAGRHQGHRRRRRRGASRLGHNGTGGWQVANGAGGNVDRLISRAAENLEKLAGMARATGVPVRVDRASVKSAALLQN